MAQNYCTTCVYRSERKTVSKTKDGRSVMDFAPQPLTKIITNKGCKCGVGYKQAALTHEATANALVNGATLCSLNPFITKDEKRLRMYDFQNKLQEIGRRLSALES